MTEQTKNLLDERFALQNILDQMADGADVNISINHVHLESYGLTSDSIKAIRDALRTEVLKQYLATEEKLDKLE